MSATPPRIALVAEAVEPVVLVGGPILVILELRVVTSALRASISNVPVPALRSLGGVGVSWSLNEQSRGEVIPTLPDPEWSRVGDLDSTESQRAVVDLSPLVRGAHAGVLTLHVLLAT